MLRVSSSTRGFVLITAVDDSALFSLLSSAVALCPGTPMIGEQL
jgi:hypothetical protein